MALIVIPRSPLEIHRVEHLCSHLTIRYRSGPLQEPVGQGRLPVVDVGNDAEVANSRLGAHGGSGEEAALYRFPYDC